MIMLFLYTDAKGYGVAIAFLQVKDMKIRRT